jgi:hypothetical protein
MSHSGATPTPTLAEKTTAGIQRLLAAMRAIAAAAPLEGGAAATTATATVTAATASMVRLTDRTIIEELDYDTQNRAISLYKFMFLPGYNTLQMVYSRPSYARNGTVICSVPDGSILTYVRNPSPTKCGEFANTYFIMPWVLWVDDPCSDRAKREKEVSKCCVGGGQSCSDAMFDAAMRTNNDFAARYATVAAATVAAAAASTAR